LSPDAISRQIFAGVRILSVMNIENSLETSACLYKVKIGLGLELGYAKGWIRIRVMISVSMSNPNPNPNILLVMNIENSFETSACLWGMIRVGVSVRVSYIELNILNYLG
jgi:hypothetical protein